jgi:plasmid stability protein
MATVMIRNLSTDTKTRLMERAGRNGRSLEAELRDILDTAALTDGTVDDSEPITVWMRRMLGSQGAPDVADILDAQEADRKTATWRTPADFSGC